MHTNPSRKGSDYRQAGLRLPREAQSNKQPPAFLPGTGGNKKADQGKELRMDRHIWNLRHSEIRSMRDSLLGPKAAYTEKEPGPLQEKAFFSVKHGP